MARADFIVQTKLSMWGERVQIRAGWGLGAWLLPGGWQMGLNYKRCFDSTDKDEELGSVVVQREDERVCSYRALKVLL